jgi:hypothetical protein
MKRRIHAKALSVLAGGNSGAMRALEPQGFGKSKLKVSCLPLSYRLFRFDTPRPRGPPMSAPRTLLILMAPLPTPPQFEITSFLAVLAAFAFSEFYSLWVGF